MVSLNGGFSVRAEVNLKDGAGFGVWVTLMDMGRRLLVSTQKGKHYFPT